MGVTLRKRKNGDGSTSLYLDIYHDGGRQYEFLTNLKLCKPSTPSDRQTNKENIALAESIRDKRSQELAGSDYQIVPKFKSKVDFIEYFQQVKDNYTKADKRVIGSCLFKFKEFLKVRKIKALTINQVTESLVLDFKNYLEQELNGESPANYFSKFKKVLKQAVRDKLIAINPGTEITVKRKEGIKKDVLSMEEIQLLAATPYTNESLRRAFIFSCYTGLRFVDIVAMEWRNLNFKNNRLSITQAKTGHKVDINLHPTALSILGEPGEARQKVFALPSHSAVTKDLRQWVKKAGISKHITWHCARHSFATNLIYFGVDLNTASNLLGHTGLKYIQRYTRIANAMKEQAIAILPGSEMK